jgi:hypothetical protein
MVMAKSATSMQEMEEKAAVFAEHIGRLLATVQTKAEGWLDRQALKDELTNVRDSAASLLEQLTGGSQAAAAKKSPPKKSPPKRSSPKKPAASTNKGRSGGVVDAPGKRHRKPVPSVGGRVDDSRIAKVKVAKESRRRGGR